MHSPHPPALGPHPLARLICTPPSRVSVQPCCLRLPSVGQCDPPQGLGSFMLRGAGEDHPWDTPSMQPSAASGRAKGVAVAAGQDEKTRGDLAWEAGKPSPPGTPSSGTWEGEHPGSHLLSQQGGRRGARSVRQRGCWRGSWPCLGVLVVGDRWPQSLGRC